MCVRGLWCFCWPSDVRTVVQSYHCARKGNKSRNIPGIQRLRLVLGNAFIRTSQHVPKPLVGTAQELAQAASRS